jgi:hypothetical protein
MDQTLARGFLPNVIDSAGNFSPAITVCAGNDIARPGYTAMGAASAWATAPPELAAQALIGETFDWLNVSVLNFGPNVTLGEVAAALVASGV